MMGVMIMTATASPLVIGSGERAWPLVSQDRRGAQPHPLTALAAWFGRCF